MANELTIYQSVIEDVKDIIESERQNAYSSVTIWFSATKYKLNLPSEEQLRREIERQKEIFYMQHPIQAEDTDNENKDKF